MGRTILKPGRVFTRWTVIQFKGIGEKYKQSLFECKCSCGTVKIIPAASLVNGKSKSCGCLKIERQKESVTKHGLWQNRFFKNYSGMMRRCYVPSCEDYPRYGGRGITVCDEWKNSIQKFVDWCEKTYPKDSEEKLTLDRENNDLGYSPDNCRWATKLQQNQNTRSCIYVEYGGVTYTISDFHRKFGVVSEPTFRKRRKLGWSIIDAATTPAK